MEELNFPIRSATMKSITRVIDFWIQKNKFIGLLTLGSILLLKKHFNLINLLWFFFH